MRDEWMKLEYAGRMRYFRRESLCKMYKHISYLVANARLVIDPEEIRRAEEEEKQRPKLLTAQEIVDRAAEKGH
jgi:glycine/serine hydroxymethyltransferase